MNSHDLFPKQKAVTTLVCLDALHRYVARIENVDGVATSVVLRRASAHAALDAMKIALEMEAARCASLDKGHLEQPTKRVDGSQHA